MSRRPIARIAGVEIVSTPCGERWNFYRPRLSLVRGGATLQPVRCDRHGVRGVLPVPSKRSGGAAFRARGRKVGP